MPRKVVCQAHRFFLIGTLTQDTHFNQRLESLRQRLPWNFQTPLPFIKAAQAHECPEQDRNSPLVAQRLESMAQSAGRQRVTRQADVEGVDGVARSLVLFRRRVDLHPLAVLNLVNRGQFRADMVIDK